MGLAGELVQQGGKVAIEQAGKLFKKLSPSAVDNLKNMGREMNISPKSMYDLDLHLKRVPEDAADVESIFKGMKAEDPDAFEAADGFFHTLGFGNDAAAKIEAQSLANPGRKVANVTPQPEPPPVHNITKADEEAWMKEVLVPFITKNEAQIRENKLFTNQNIGEIIEDNKLKRVSTESVKDYLADDLRDVKKLRLTVSTKGKPDKRAIVADPASSVEAMQTLKTANDAFRQGVKTATGKRAGLNPEFLNPESFRKGQIRGANFARQIFRKIRNTPEFKEFGVEQGHPIDLIKSKGVDAMAGFGPETTKANKYWNRKEFGGTILDSGATEELGIARGADFEAAEKITGKGPLAQQRKAEYLQLGILTEIWNQALIAKETKGKGMKEAIAAITKHRNAIVKGDYAALRSDFKLPGSKITIDDMLAIQILALKTGDPTTAAERVIGERMAFEWARANGLVDNQDTLKILKQYMKHINTEIDVRKAKEIGPKKFEYSSRDINKTGIEGFPEGRKQTLPRGPAQPVDWSGT